MSYTTTQYVQEELRATVPFSNSTIPSLQSVQRWIEDASDEIDGMRGFVASETAHTTYIDYSNEEFINTEHFPIISVTSLSENTNSLGSDLGEGWVAKTENTHFFVNSEKGQLEINTLRWNPLAGKRRLKAIYTSGYTTVEPSIRSLATKMVAYQVLNTLISSNIEEGNTGGSVSVGSINIVEPADYGVRSFSKLGMDIETLKSDLSKSTGVYRYTG